MMGLAIWFRQVILHAVALHKKGIWCPFSVDLKQRLIKFFLWDLWTGFYNPSDTTGVAYACPNATLAGAAYCGPDGKPSYRGICFVMYFKL